MKTDLLMELVKFDLCNFDQDKPLSYGVEKKSRTKLHHIFEFRYSNYVHS